MMQSDPDPFQPILDKFLQWAIQVEDIRAAIIVGSHARQTPPPDEWSDLDLMIYTHRPDQFLQDTSWLRLGWSG